MLPRVPRVELPFPKAALLGEGLVRERHGDHGAWGLMIRPGESSSQSLQECLLLLPASIVLWSSTCAPTDVAAYSCVTMTQLNFFLYKLHSLGHCVIVAANYVSILAAKHIWFPVGNSFAFALHLGQFPQRFSWNEAWPSQENDNKIHFLKD